MSEGTSIARALALQGGACPQLVVKVVKVNLKQYHLQQEDGQTMEEAMRSGSCVKLGDLDLGESSGIGADGFKSIILQGTGGRQLPIP